MVCFFWFVLCLLVARLSLFWLCCKVCFVFGFGLVCVVVALLLLLFNCFVFAAFVLCLVALCV